MILDKKTSNSFSVDAIQFFNHFNELSLSRDYLFFRAIILTKLILKIYKQCCVALVYSWGRAG